MYDKQKIVSFEEFLNLFLTHFFTYVLVFQITQKEIKNYSKDLKEFYQRFKNEGPGSVGSDLDKGRGP